MTSATPASCKSGTPHEFWEQNWSLLYATAKETATCWLSVRFHQDIEEVAVESIEALIEARNTDLEITVARRRLVCITKRKAIDHVRYHQAQKRDIREVTSLDAETENGPMEIGSPGGDPLTDLLTAEDGKVLGELIADLPEKRRGILVDVYYRDCSYQEVAQSYGYDINSIGGEISRAKTQLYNAIKKRTGLFNELQETLGVATRLLQVLFCLV